MICVTIVDYHDNMMMQVIMKERWRRKHIKKLINIIPT